MHGVCGIHCIAYFYELTKMFDGLKCAFMRMHGHTVSQSVRGERERVREEEQHRHSSKLQPTPCSAVRCKVYGIAEGLVDIDQEQ